MKIISKIILLSCSLAAFLTISPGRSFANDLATEIATEVATIAAETMLKTPVNFGRGEIEEPSDLLDLPINGVIESVVKNSLSKTLKTLVQKGIVQGSGDVWVDRITTRVVTQVRNTLSSSANAAGKAGASAATTFVNGILIGVTLDITSEIVEEELVSAGHPYLGPAIGYGIQQGKVAYAAKTGGPLGAVVAQTMLTSKQIGRVYRLSLELEEEMNDARASSAYASAASDALRLRTRYMQADSKPQIESQIRREMRDSLSDYYGDDLPPEAEHFIDTIIYQYQSAEVRKYEVAQGLAEEILQNPEHAGAYRERAEKFISKNFSSEERYRLVSLTNDIYASIASGQVAEMRSLLNGLARSETPEKDRQKLVVLAKSVDPELSRIESEHRLLETIVQNLEKYERAFGQDTTAVQVLSEASGVISSLERKITTPSEPDLCDNYDCTNSLTETPREELPTEPNLVDAERLQQQRQAELDRQKAERQTVLAEVVSQRAQLEKTKIDAERLFQDARNRVSTLRFQEIENSKSELRNLSYEIQSLRDRKQASAGFDALGLRQQQVARDIRRLRAAIRLRQRLGSLSDISARQVRILNRYARNFEIVSRNGQEPWQQLLLRAAQLLNSRNQELLDLNTRLSEIEAAGVFSDADERRFQRLLKQEQDLQSQLETLQRQLRDAEDEMVQFERHLSEVNQKILDAQIRIASLRQELVSKPSGDDFDFSQYRTAPSSVFDAGEKFTMVKKMFALALEGISPEKIAFKLKQEFPDQQLSGLNWADKKLRDSFYCGKWIIKKGQKGERFVDLRKIILPDGTRFQPAVSELDFETIQRARKKKYYPDVVRKRVNPLPGLVICQSCGRMMSPAYRKVKQAGGRCVEQLGFECVNKSTEAKCSQGRVKADIIFSAIEGLFYQCGSKLTKRTYQQYLVGLKMLEDHAVKSKKAAKARVAATLNSKIGERQQMIERRALLIRERAYDRHSKDHFEGLIEALSDEIQALQDERVELRVEGNRSFASFKRFLELRENLPQYWIAADFEQKAKLAKLVILNLEISGREMAKVSIKKPFSYSGKGPKMLHGVPEGIGTLDLQSHNLAF